MKIYITDKAQNKIKYFTQECPDEISGFGKIEPMTDDEGNATAIITDIEIFKQEVSATHSTIEPQAIAEFMTEKTRAGEDLSGWVVWWHSHATMDTFLSGTDLSTIEGNKDFPHLISIVTNKAGSYLTQVDIFQPFRVTIENVELITWAEEDPSIIDWVKAQIEEKVKKRTFSNAGYKHHNYNAPDTSIPVVESPEIDSVTLNQLTDDEVLELREFYALEPDEPIIQSYVDGYIGYFYDDMGVTEQGLLVPQDTSKHGIDQVMNDIKENETDNKKRRKGKKGKGKHNKK